MSDEWLNSDWGQAVEYGRHLFGVFPMPDEQRVTGVLHHDGNVFESYVDSGSWKQYPNWVREYKNTPLNHALDAFVHGEEITTTECVVDNRHFTESVLESAGMGGWRFEYERKRAFRSAVLRGDVNLGTPAIINRYGDVYCPADEAERVRQKYWEYVDRNYTHRHSHQSVTKSKSGGD